MEEMEILSTFWFEASFHAPAWLIKFSLGFIDPIKEAGYTSVLEQPI